MFHALPLHRSGRGDALEISSSGEVTFTWDYDARSDELLKLYSKGKQEQWDAEQRIDWSLPVDPEDPMQMDDQVVPLYGTKIWDKLSEKQRVELRYHSQVFNLSQFLHGEQGALVCAARIVQDVPRIESKFYAATQVMDEARHVEAYRRLLTEKFKFVYPISKPLKTLLEQALSDKRWDFTLPGHAGADRRPGAGRLPAHPRLLEESAVPGGERLCDAG